jgi:hypothetical protein
MKIQSLFIAILLGISTGVFAEATAPTGAAATGLCKDGTAWTGESKRGACRGHKGIKEWYGDKAAAPAAATAGAVSAPTATPAPMPSNSISGSATGLCKDGTQYTGSSKRGACRGHKGLQQWYADDKPITAATPAATAPTATTPSAGATGLCKDGTEYTGESKRGACRGHKGLKEWYADKATTTPAAANTTPAATAPEAAATPAASAPSAGATGLCKDGTEYTGESKRGACRGHKGLKEWYADKAATTPAASTTAPAATAPEAAAIPTATTPSAGATGLCKDGTEYTGESKRGACRGHKGLKEWYADKQPAAETAPVQAAPAATAPAATPTPSTTAPAAAAPVAGSGKVWVNTDSKIYHCEGTKYYGKTKQGEYMDEAQAQAQGFRANRKKTCGLKP